MMSTEVIKRWHPASGKHIENPAIDAFLEEVIAVCKKHNLSLSHEDGHGAFEVEPFDESYSAWLMGAHDASKKEKNPKS